MASKRARDSGSRNADVAFCVNDFLRRLHQAIGGSGPDLSGFDGNQVRPFRLDLPDRALEPDDFRTEYLWCNILKKYDDGKSSEFKRDAALGAFRAAEQHCASQPDRFRNSPASKDASHLSGHAILHSAARKIRELLGEFSWDHCVDHFDFGPGASTKLSRRKSDRWHKFGVHPDVSTMCGTLAETYLLGVRPAWGRFLLDKYESLYTTCDSNRITTVPKDYRTDRPIAIEPLLNMFFQKGIGGVIRTKLRSVGQDLNDQSRNQALALEASRDDNLATIDLSSASDTISRWVVEELLPPDWLAALECCRSPFGTLDSGEKILYRKFSSMGNGFTFELESLIFWAICSSVVQVLADQHGAKERRVSVYGDDIIVPSYAANQVLDALVLFGFIPNKEKSYTSGPFRESCGMHGFRGCDVTPFFVRGPIKKLSDLFLLHNNVMRWAAKRSYASRDARLQGLCSWVRSHAPERWRKPRLCDGYGDGAFIGSFDECTPRAVRRRGFQGYRVEVLTSKVRSLDSYGEDQRLFRTLHQIERSGSMNLPPYLGGQKCHPDTRIRPDVSLVPQVQSGWRLTTSIVFCWNDLPAWINLDPAPLGENK